jgi:hypothetical protein
MHVLDRAGSRLPARRSPCTFSGIVTAVTVVGVRGHFVAVAAHVGRGLPSLTLTGLPGGAGVLDACDRISETDPAVLKFLLKVQARAR